MSRNTKGASIRISWSCDKCTFANDPLITYCEMCGSDRASLGEYDLKNSSEVKITLPNYQSVDRELFECNGECGNPMAQFIEQAVKDKV